MDWVFSLVLRHRPGKNNPYALELLFRKHSQIAKTLGSTSIRHRFKISDRSLIDVDPKSPSCACVGENFFKIFSPGIPSFMLHNQHHAYLSRLPWIFMGAPLTFNGAPGNNQGNLTALTMSWWPGGGRSQRISSQDQLHEPRIFYPSVHWPETVTNAHVSAHFR